MATSGALDRGSGDTKIEGDIGLKGVIEGRDASDRP